MTGLVPVALTAEKRHSLTSTNAVDSEGSVFMGFISREGMSQRCWHSPQLVGVKHSQEKQNS